MKLRSVAILMAFAIVACGCSRTNSPTSEQEFVNTINHYRDMHESAGNNVQRDAVIGARTADLCSKFTPMVAQNWIGTIKNVDKTSVNGMGILKIKISDNITLLTPQNFLGELKPEEMVPSRLMDFLSRQSEGTVIVFSGTFYPDKERCFRELSITDAGSLDNPDFEFKFSSVGSPVQH